jgi:hypothetical protein
MKTLNLWTSLRVLITAPVWLTVYLFMLLVLGCVWLVAYAMHTDYTMFNDLWKDAKPMLGWKGGEDESS